MSYTACIIGLGRVGAGYDMPPYPMRGNSHAGAISLCPGVVLTAGADMDQARREAAAEFWKIPTFSSFSDMLRELRPDIVSVCVDPASQSAACQAAINAGAKAIVCEKPFIVETASAKNVIETCRNSGIILAVNHWMRWSTQWEAVRSLIADGTLGEIQQVRYLYSKGLFNSGTHAIDILRYLFGDVIQVQSSRCTGIDTGENNIDAIITFENSIKADLRSLDYAHHFTTECDVIGTRGRIVAGGTFRYWKRTPVAEGLPGFSLEEAPFLPASNAPPPFLNMYAEVIERLQQESLHVRCSGSDGLQAVIIAKAIERSWHLGGKNITMMKDFGYVE